MPAKTIKLSIHPNLLNMALDWLGLKEDLRVKESSIYDGSLVFDTSLPYDTVLSELMTTILAKWIKNNREMDDLEKENFELKAARGTLNFVVMGLEEGVIMGTFSSREKVDRYLKYCEEQNMRVEVIDTILDSELDLID